MFVSGKRKIADFFPPFRGDQQEYIHANQFVFFITGQIGESLVAVQDDAAIVDGNAPERGVVQDAEAFLAFP